MGLHNSSETRVRPVFNELLDRWPTGSEWLADLCTLAMNSRSSDVFAPSEIGSLVASETPAARADRLGPVFERVVPPPSPFFEWLLRHPDRMQIADNKNFGASSPHAQDWRPKLFGNDTRRDEAIAEGLQELAKHGAERSRHEWWAFEGFTHIDCCLITERTVLFVEGKRTETVSPSTRWFQKRSQLWRNLEAAQQFARGKQFAVILAVEQEGDGKAALQEADARLNDSYPHLMDAERIGLSRHLLGFVTWPQVVQRFSLPANCLPSTVADVR